jgi:hypothetical protein
VIVHPSTLTRIEDFTKHSLLPAFVSIKELLETPYKLVTIASNAETGIDAVDAMLQQMHLDKPYLTQPLDHSFPLKDFSNSAQTWIGESLYVEILQDSAAEPILAGQYCMSIEFSIISTDSSTEHIRMRSIVGHSQLWEETIQIRRYLFKPNLDFLQIDSSDILLHFVESFQTFEKQALEPEGILEKKSRAETLQTAPALPSNELNLVQPISDSEEQHLPNSESLTTESDALTPQQQLYALQQRATDLSRQLALSPHNPLNCKLNSDLPLAAQIIPIRDHHSSIIGLCLEYSPTITESELTELLQRLGHYQHLEHLANQHHILEEQLQTWLKRYGQPSPGAIVHHLQTRITHQSQHLYPRLAVLAESCLQSLTAQDFKTEREHATLEHQQGKMLLDQLEQNPILGYLDSKLLASGDHLQSVHPFIEPNRPTNINAQHFQRKDKSLQLNHIESCSSEQYQTYRQRYPSLSAPHLAIRYTLTQKLYPNRSVSVGLAVKDQYPRIELLWGDTEEILPPDNPFAQIWRSFPPLPTHPPQWLVITVTTETQTLKTITLADGRIAQEGTREYLERALLRMSQRPDAYTHDLGILVAAALAQGCVKWMHLHQTQDPDTGEPRDIVQLQFQLH